MSIMYKGVIPEKIYFQHKRIMELWKGSKLIWKRTAPYEDERQYIIPNGEYKFGDICLYDRKKKEIICVDSDHIRAFPRYSYDPLGIVVVPQDHDAYQNGKAGICSLKNMSCEDPDNGTFDVDFCDNSTSIDNIFSLFSDNIELFTNYTTSQSSKSAYNWGSFASDAFDYEQYQRNSILYYSNTRSANGFRLASPFNENNTKNDDFFLYGNGDPKNFNGIYNNLTWQRYIQTYSWKTGSNPSTYTYTTFIDLDVTWEIISGEWIEEENENAYDEKQWTCVSPGPNNSAIIRMNFISSKWYENYYWGYVCPTCVSRGENEHDYLNIGPLNYPCTREQYQYSHKGIKDEEKTYAININNANIPNYVEFCYSKDGSYDVLPDNATVFLNKFYIEKYEGNFSINNKISFSHIPHIISSYRFHPTGTNKGDWYTPSIGEATYFATYYNKFQELSNKVLKHFYDIDSVSLPYKLITSSVYNNYFYFVNLPKSLGEGELIYKNNEKDIMSKAYLQVGYYVDKTKYIREPNDYRVGDILIYCFEDKKLYIIDWQGIEAFSQDEYEVLGIVVVPSDHNVYENGKCGVMSLKWMNPNTPNIGGYNNYTMYIGYDYYLPTNTSSVRYYKHYGSTPDNPSNSLSTATIDNNILIAQDGNILQNTKFNPKNSNLSYIINYTNGYYGATPFNKDGSKCSDFFAVNSIGTYPNGKVLSKQLFDPEELTETSSMDIKLTWEVVSGKWNRDKHKLAYNFNRYTCESPGTNGSTILRCTFKGKPNDVIRFSCISKGESNYDYLTIGKLDQECTRTSYETTLKGKPNTQTIVSYTLSDHNEHFVEFCYSKDNSQDTPPDNAEVYALRPWSTSTVIMSTNDSTNRYFPQHECCYLFYTPGTHRGDWYLPSIAELVYVYTHKNFISFVCSKIMKSFYKITNYTDITYDTILASSTHSYNSTTTRYMKCARSNYIYSSTSSCSVKAFLQIDVYNLDPDYVAPGPGPITEVPFGRDKKGDLLIYKTSEDRKFIATIEDYELCGADDNNLVVIGVVALPSSMNWYKDNSIGIISLNCMSSSTPETGSTTLSSIVFSPETTLWGGVSAANAKLTNNGKERTKSLLDKLSNDLKNGTGSFGNSTSNYPHALASYRYTTPGTNRGDWFIPSTGEINKAFDYNSDKGYEILYKTASILRNLGISNYLYSGYNRSVITCTESTSNTYKHIYYVKYSVNTGPDSESTVVSKSASNPSFAMYKFYYE